MAFRAGMAGADTPRTDRRSAQAIEADNLKGKPPAPDATPEVRRSNKLSKRDWRHHRAPPGSAQAFLRGHTYVVTDFA